MKYKNIAKCNEIVKQIKGLNKRLFVLEGISRIRVMSKEGDFDLYVPIKGEEDTHFEHVTEVLICGVQSAMEDLEKQLDNL